jgi:hypothetical protein
MAAFERGDWGFVGVVAKATAFIPIGQGSFRIMQFESAGLWGIESDAGDYLKEVYSQERDNLLGELRTLGAALRQSPDFVQEFSE